MFGMNYRYELNPEKGTIKLAPTRKFWLGYAAANIIPLVGLYAFGAYSEAKEKRELNAKNDETPDEN